MQREQRIQWKIRRGFPRRRGWQIVADQARALSVFLCPKRDGGLFSLQLDPQCQQECQPYSLVFITQTITQPKHVGATRGFGFSVGSAVVATGGGTGHGRTQW